MSLFQWVGRSRNVEQMSLFFMSLFRGGGQVQTLICPMSPILLFFFLLKSSLRNWQWPQPFCSTCIINFDHIKCKISLYVDDQNIFHSLLYMISNMNTIVDIIRPTTLIIKAKYICIMYTQIFLIYVSRKIFTKSNMFQSKNS